MEKEINIIYLVQACSGGYDTYSEYPVRAFPTEKEANDFMGICNTESERIHSLKMDINKEMLNMHHDASKAVVSEAFQRKIEREKNEDLHHKFDPLADSEWLFDLIIYKVIPIKFGLDR